VVKYSDNQYRLLINGTQLGAAGAVSFSETGTLATTLGLSTSTPAQAAVDAWIQIDGNDIYRASNQISDALPGTTLNLVKPSATPVTLTIAADPDAIAAKVQTMVSAYNSAMALIKKQNTYSGEAKTDSLIGDSTLLEIKRRLQSIISGQVSAVTGDYKALSRVGISTNRDGSLTLDTSALKKAITTDLDSVTALFSYSDNNSSTDNDGVAVRLISALDDILRSSTGLLAARQSGLTDTVESIDTRVAALQRSVDTYEAGLKKQFTALETLLSSLQSQGSQLKIS